MDPNAATDGSARAGWRRRLARCDRPALVAALYSLLLFAAGFALHPILGWTSELDNYVGQARSLRAGTWPYDVCHPLGYPAAIAAFAPLFGGDHFVAGRFVSAVSAGLVLWTGHRLVRPAFGAGSAWFATALLALHPVVVVLALHASSDMLAAALAALTLLLAARAVRGTDRATLFWLGLVFGLAYWTRYPAAALLVVVLPAVWLAARRTIGERALRIALTGLGAAVGLAPHCAMTHAQFGRLFHDENWRNLATAYRGHQLGWMDFQYLYTAPFDSWWSVVRQDPAGIFAQGLERWVELFARDLPVFLTGGPDWSSPGPAEWLLYAAIPVGWVASSALGRPGLALGGCFSVCYLTAIAFTFVPWERLTLMTYVPLLGATAVLPWLAGRALPRWPRLARSLQVGLALALLAPIAARVPARLDWLARSEPHAELAAIERLVREHGSDIAIGTPMVALAEHAGIELRGVTLAHGWDFDADRYVQELAQVAADSRLDFVVLGRVTFGSSERLHLLARAELPPGIERVREDAEVLIWRFRQPFTPPPPPPPRWQPVVAIAPNPCDGGEVTFDVDLAPVAGELQQVGLIVEDPSGRWHYASLPRDGDRATMRIPADGMMRGDWRVRAHLLLPDARVTGPVTVLTRR
jgi:4-amino-4-deoxy-L-arabinose transferase-like glycosyltransferase